MKLPNKPNPEQPTRNQWVTVGLQYGRSTGPAKPYRLLRARENLCLVESPDRRQQGNDHRSASTTKQLMTKRTQFLVTSIDPTGCADPQPEPRAGHPYLGTPRLLRQLQVPAGGQSQSPTADTRDPVAHGSAVVAPRLAAVGYALDPSGDKRSCLSPGRCEEALTTNERHSRAFKWVFCAVARPAVLRLVLRPRTPVVLPGARSPLAAERGMGWGKKIGRANGRSRPLVLRHNAATIPLGGVFLALGHDFDTENRACRTLFSTPAKPGHRLLQFFLLAISTTYAPDPF